MKKEMQDIIEIDEKVTSELAQLNDSSCDASKDLNSIRVIKNNIYQKASKAFVFNLKRLIQLETTQKNLAHKIGISEDLLSKYKTGEAFPSIETLIFICKMYDLDLYKLVYETLDISDISGVKADESCVQEIFEKEYYVYFFVTNFKNEGKIHEGIVRISDANAVFGIVSEDAVIKEFKGSYNAAGKLIYFNLHSMQDGNAYINMIRPNLNKSRYVGGAAMLMLSSDANSKPCVQKILFSKVRIDRKENYNKLKNILDFKINGEVFSNMKISSADDETAYNFVQSIL